MSVRRTKQRIRITFGKQGALRFVGHLDMAKTWERVLRRAQLPLEYTQGFNRRPRMQFADALMLGATSHAELLDVWLEDVITLDAATVATIQAVSPVDLQTLALAEVEITSRALPATIHAATYSVRPADGVTFPEDLADRIEGLLGSQTLMRERRKKTYDLRPLIYDLVLQDAGVMMTTLSIGPNGTARPDELIDALGLAKLHLRIHRERIVLDQE